MPFDYDALYRDERHALGDPGKEFVRFFKSYAKPNAFIFDVGCGQGRDALFVARLGHNVLGVDLSPAGIADMLRDASAEGLSIEGEVADITSYQPDRQFDIVLIDRTLHMLAEDDRLAVLDRLSNCVVPEGFLLLADEKSNLTKMKALLENQEIEWRLVLEKGGHLFVQRTASDDVSG